LSTALRSTSIFSRCEVRSTIRVAVTIASTNASFSARDSGSNPSKRSRSSSTASASSVNQRSRRLFSVWFSATVRATAMVPPKTGTMLTIISALVWASCRPLL
jgi:hypothetical protein